MPRRDASDHPYRCVGIGVGPANLSLASLLYSHPDVSNVFVDRRPSFGWHDGQLVPGATLQVSMLKDLVTLAEPTNAFSFLAYLHAQGRIYHFVNAQFDSVPRQEFWNYLEWASRTNENVVFGEEVRSVEFDGLFVVHTNRRVLSAESIAVGVGKVPWVPLPARDKLGGTQFHVTDFVSRARELGGKRVAVVGGGQSGAEAVLDLISRVDGRPRRVTWISRRHNYFPIDDSPFTNDYYMPCHSEHFFAQPRTVRDRFNAQHILTSDGIALATLRRIYQQTYLHRLVDEAEDSVALYPNRVVVDVTGSAAGGWELTLSHNDRPGMAERLESDVIVWATGFRTAPMDFLSPIAGRLEREGAEYKIDDDFAVRWDGPPDRTIFMQNAVRQQRGLADMNLSLVAWRSRRIADRLLGVKSDPQRRSFIEWSGLESDVDRRA
jgi:lysine N6-hydroxylase